MHMEHISGNAFIKLQVLSCLLRSYCRIYCHAGMLNMAPITHRITPTQSELPAFCSQPHANYPIKQSSGQSIGHFTNKHEALLQTITASSVTIREASKVSSCQLEKFWINMADIQPWNNDASIMQFHPAMPRHELRENFLLRKNHNTFRTSHA